jgi:hypothetical protein
MTCEKTEAGLWRLGFSEAEADFIINTLARMGAHYQDDVAKMPPALRAYWQGTLTRSGDASKGDLKEAQEMLAEARGELRAERLGFVENWIREYELAEDRNPWSVEVSTDDRDEFIAMLNDRRMLLSLELGITEADMDADLSEIANETRRAGILEIDVLGHFILVMLGRQIYRP